MAMAHQHKLQILCFVLLTLAALHGSNAVEYSVSNNAGASTGGTRFDKHVGADYANETLSLATEFIWKLLQLTSDGERKNVEKVRMVVETLDGMACASNNEIHVSAGYIHR